jgi:hypothetical protein
MSNFQPCRHRTGRCGPQASVRKRKRRVRVVLLAALAALAGPGLVERAFAEDARQQNADPPQSAIMLTEYYREMSVPKPFIVRKGQDFAEHQRQLRKRVLQSVSLWPLPERIPLDVHSSEPLDHAWCTVRRVYYQLWPGVYSSGLLFMPKQLDERPAPAMLCPHGHWKDGNAHPEVQKRCLNFARMGYVTFSSTQNHYEDPYVGVSHQTLMIWNNMRALDYEMLTALDPRVKAATIVGLTCDFREIMVADDKTVNRSIGYLIGTPHLKGLMVDTADSAAVALASAIARWTPCKFLTFWWSTYSRCFWPMLTPDRNGSMTWAGSLPPI